MTEGNGHQDGRHGVFEALRKDPRAVGLTYYHNYTLLALSHSFEDLIFSTTDGASANPFQALIYATFESPEMFIAELPRYRLLAEQSKQIYAFVGGEIGDRTGRRLPPNMTVITVDPTDPIVREWDLLIYTPRFAALMSARELDNEYDDPSIRSYEGLWTFDLKLIRKGVEIFEDVVSSRLGKRYFSGLEYIKRRPIESEDPFWILTTMTVDMIHYLQDVNREAITKTIEIELEKERTESAYKDTLLRLANAAGFREGETGRHIIRIGEYSALLAHKMGFSKEMVETIRLAAPMHDIGKIGIPDAILRKPDRFTLDEWTIMKTHTEIGAEILKDPQSSIMRLARQIALCHHEKYDGTGYPHGLIKDEIPVEAKIVSIVDVFDALISPRCYKAAYGPEEAVDMIRQGVGSHFDPAVAQVFFDSVEELITIHERLKDD